MSWGLALYQGITLLGGTMAPLAAGVGRPSGAWRAGFRGLSEEAERAAGSVWIHAASLGEVGAARAWIDTLIWERYHPPFLLTTRTTAGLGRARAELGDRVAARIAPHDFPQTVGALLEAAAPWRLDIIETEIWPNLILEAVRRRVPVVLVGATVSRRTAGWLTALGVAGRGLFGTQVYVLAQSERHAERFTSLGVPMGRVRVIGDLKAEAPAPPGRGERPVTPFRSRPALVFGSLRPGEEATARLLADVLEAHRVEVGSPRAAWAVGRTTADPFEGRCRSLLVVAPRHPAGEHRARAALRAAGFEVHVRDEMVRAESDLATWVEEISRRPGPRAAVLATRGELAGLYGLAWGAVVGGTFAPFGGHNVWEPAARGCPVIAGPHHDEVRTAVEALQEAGGGVVALDERHLKTIVTGWLQDEDLEQRGASAARAAAGASGAAGRGLKAISAWGLTP